MLHHWHSAADRGQSVRTVFIDFAKAFDHVDHNILVAKLLAFGLPDIIIRWVFSFLTDRRQRVKIGDVLSDWMEVTAGMPQGSFLGPLTFIVLIDNLRAACLSHKYVDDTTLTEILNRGTVSTMQDTVDDFVQQAAQNAMNVNGKKTKEMLVGPITNDPPPQLIIDGLQVERVDTFKLLGAHVSSDLKWAQHVDAMHSKVASRLYFLKQLGRSGVSREDLLMFYKTVIRPVLEYACPVWHSSLTGAQSETLESLQRRAMRIIHPQIAIHDHQLALILNNIEPLKERREILTVKFFARNVLDSQSCLNYLLPERRDPDIVKRLRRARTYEPLTFRTEKFKKSFLPYCLSNYQ
jgi:hypothetical protein